MGSPKSNRVAVAMLIVSLVALVALVFVASRINGVERTEAPQTTTRDRATIAADPDIVIDPTPEPTPTLAAGPLVGMRFLNEDCAVELVLSNNSTADAVVSIQVEATTGFDQYEDVVPAQGMLSLTLIRNEPVTYVFVTETSGLGEAIIDWAPDYTSCDSAPATSDDAGDSQYIERPEAAQSEPPVTMI